MSPGGSAQGLFSTPQILEAFAADDRIFVQNCGRLMALSNSMRTMSHFEFRNICDTKLESIGQRIARYQEVLMPSRLIKEWANGLVGCQTGLYSGTRISHR